MHSRHDRRAFTLIELLVVIAIIAILAVVVVLTLNPAELLRQSRDANRVSDMATLTSALNLYTTDQSSAVNFNLGNASGTYISTYDTNATSTAGDQCQGSGLPSLTPSTGQAYQCAPSSSYRNLVTGWIPVNFNSLTSGSPIGNLPVDPANQTSSGLFYSYNTNGSQFEVTANLESQKYKLTYGASPQTSLFPEVISGGNNTISALYNPNGLIGYWPLNEGNGSSSIDASGNGDGGTWSGTASGTNGTYYTSGKVGNYAGIFNGVNDNINAGSSSLLSPSIFTISLWVNPQTVSNNPLPIFNAGTSGWDVFLLSNGTQWRLSDVGGGGSVTNYIAAAPLNTWSFLTATYTSGTAIVYTNGGNSVAGSMALITPNGPFNIGHSSFTGSIDEVRLYNRVLSAAEVMALYNSEK